MLSGRRDEVQSLRCRSRRGRLRQSRHLLLQGVLLLLPTLLLENEWPACPQRLGSRALERLDGDGLLGLQISTLSSRLGQLLAVARLASLECALHLTQPRILLARLFELRKDHVALAPRLGELLLKGGELIGGGWPT